MGAFRVTSLVQNINLNLSTQQNAAQITEQQETIDAQQETIGAQATEIEYASGNGAEPANEAVELFGCFPLYRGQAHARNHRGANGSITIPVGSQFWYRPVGACFFKGCHDNLKIHLSGVAGGISHDTTADTQCPFDEMSTLAGVSTQTKALEQIFTIPDERRAVFEGSCDKGEWCEPGCLGYRVHCTADAIYYNKYSHPTLRTTEYLCESTCFRIGDGMIFQHVDEDKKNILVAITKAPNLVNPQDTRYQGTLTPRFMNALNSLKSAEGRALTEAKLVASGKTASEATAAFDEFMVRLNHQSSDAIVESGAHNDNAALWKTGIGYADQVCLCCRFDDVNNEVQVFEQFNYSDGIFTEFTDGFAFTGAELSANVQAVINVLLADSPLQYEFEGAAGKYQNRLRTKAFPANSKFGLKKVSRQAIAVAQNKTIAEVDEEQRLYSVNSNTELKSVLKWRQWKAAERYFLAHRDVAADGSIEKAYYDKKAEDYFYLALAMASHAATFDNVSDLTEPTLVPWNAGDGGLLDVQVEGDKLVSGYSYHSSRVVTIANSASERTFVPAYELAFDLSATRERQVTSLDGTPILESQLGIRPHIYMGKYETGPYSVAGTVYNKAQLIAHTYYKNKYGIDIPLYSEEHGYSQPVYEANFIKSKGNAVCAGGLSSATFGSNIRDQDYAGVITSYNHGGMKIVDALNDGLDTPLYDIQSIKNRIIQGLDYEDGFRAFIIDIAGVDGTIDTDMTSKHVYFIRWGHPSGASAYEDAITFENFASSVIYHDETTGVAADPIVGNLVTGPIIHVVTAIYPANGVGFPDYGVTDEMARLDEEMAIINANIAGGQDAHFFVLSWGDSWNYMIDLLDASGHLDKTYTIWWCSYYKEGLKIVTSAEMDKTSEFYTDITDVTSELYDPRFNSLQGNHLATMGMVDFMSSAELYLSAKKADGSLPQSDAVAKLSDDITFRSEFGTIASPLTGLPKKHSDVKIITVTPDMVSAGFSFAAPNTVAADVFTTQTRVASVETTTTALTTKNAFYVTTSDTDISPGGLFIRFLDEVRLLTQPHVLVPTKSTTSMAREWRRLKQGTQLIQTTAPIYLWFNGYAPHGGYLQDFFPFSTRTVDEENQYLYDLWELPTSTAADFQSGPALELLQSDIDTSLNGEVFAFPFVRNTGSIMGQYNFEITGLESFRDKTCRMLPNSILSAALQNAGINFTQLVLGGSSIAPSLQDGTIDGAEYNSLLNNVDIGMLDQSGAQYCNTTICQEYLSVYLILVNATFWDSLTDEQREAFHSARRSINEEAFTSDTSANETLLTQLRAGEFPGITESTISPTGITELKALTDAYVAERIDPANENYNPTMESVWKIYNPTN